MSDERRFTIVVAASTVPAGADDTVPRFVLDQAIAMAAIDHRIAIHILAPHCPASHGKAWPQTETDDGRVTQHRFRYAWRRWEVLTDHGIMPAIAERPARAMLVPALMVAQFFALWILVRTVRPDVIYAHWFTPQALVARAVSRVTRTPFGFTTHASDIVVWRRFGAMGRHLVRSTTQRASFVSAVSSQTAQKLTAFFDGDAREELLRRMKLIPMGVDVTHHELDSGDRHHVAIIARLVPKKGIDVLLEAWPRVLDRIPNARLTIAGDGPLRSSIAQAALALGPSVAVLGYVAGAAKDRVLADAGVVVQPSVIAADGDSDGLPVGLLEGIAAGRIAVASDASGAQDLLTNGVNGYVVPAGDPQALAHALVLAMNLDGERRNHLLSAARQVAARVAWPHVAAEHVAMIKNDLPATPRAGA